MDKRVTAEAPADETGAAPAHPGRRRTITLIVVAVLLIGGSLAGYVYYAYSSGFVTTDDAFIDARVVRIAPQDTGTLVALPARDNTHVKAGTLLAEIDPAAPDAALNAAQAQLAQAEAGVAQAQAQIGQANAAVADARAKKEQADVAAQNARQQADRYRTLTKRSGTDVISSQTLDDAVATAAQSRAAADSAATAIDSALSGVTAAEAGLNAAKSLVNAAEANVRTAQVNVDRLAVKAPIDGQVVQVSVNIGSYVQPGMQIMAIVPDELYVTANYKETQIDRIKPGARVDLIVDAFPDVKFEGTVKSIQNAAGQAFQLLPPENATGNFVKVVQRVPVRISIDSPSPLDYPIGPGMSVQPSIVLERSKPWYVFW